MLEYLYENILYLFCKINRIIINNNTSFFINKYLITKIQCYIDSSYTAPCVIQPLNFARLSAMSPYACRQSCEADSTMADTLPLIIVGTMPKSLYCGTKLNIIV